MMKVDSQPFPLANMVELSDLGPMRRRDEQRKEAASGKLPQDEDEPEQEHVTKEQVRHIHN